MTRAGGTTPSVAELLAAATVVSVPMRVRFRGVQHREAVLLRGPAGWGEFAPFPEYDDEESSRWLAAAVEAAWSGWPEPVRSSVPVNATVPAVPSASVAEVLSRYDGCTTAKVKVAERGQSPADDVARVTEVRRLMGPSARIRVDANGAWDVEEALTVLGRLAPLGLEYAEQPCATVEELAELRLGLAKGGIDLPVAADESVRKAQDPLRVARLGAADLVVVKVAPLGGVRAALDLVAGCGLPAVVSSALDTSVGIAAGVALAAALPRLDHACGLGTVELLARDVTEPGLVPVDGEIPVAAARAVATAPQLPGLAAVSAPGDRVRWWQERLVRCWALLGAAGTSAGQGLHPPENPVI